MPLDPTSEHVVSEWLMTKNVKCPICHQQGFGVSNIVAMPEPPPSDKSFLAVPIICQKCYFSLFLSAESLGIGTLMTG